MINNTMNKKYKLNKIDNYITNPRNIPEERKLLFESTQSSSFKGVHYDNEKKHYNASIYFNNETLHLCCNNNEIECAKIYNQQALYYNNIYNTNYILNDIPDYITIAKNVHEEYEKNRLEKKSSVYYGVNKLPDGRYRALLVFNKKQLKLGNFTNEIDAAKCYNNKAMELNKDFNKSYKINMF